MPSSVILRMRYEPESRVLEIVYRGGRGTYHYFDVPMEEWKAFRASGSKGTYLNEVFKAKNYRYERSAVKNHDRDAKENEQAQEQAKFLEWGETWAFPEPRA